MEVLTRTAIRKRKRRWRRLFKLSILLLTISLCAVAAVVTYAYQLEPPSLSVQETSVLYSANEEVIGEFHQGQNRHWIPLENMGDAIVEATLAIEDRRFYDHQGFDFFRIGGAVVTNVRSNSMAQGASTITQQYARNLFLTHDKTWTRKMDEAFYALRLELHYTKSEILEGYLNTIYYGHGAYGIEAAANLYFQKNAEDLTIAEAAMLAGIPKGPNIYSPFINEDRAKGRQETVLFTMEEAGFITSEERQSYVNEELSYAVDDDIEANVVAPYFQETVLNWLRNDLGIDSSVLESGGLEIHTTLDTSMQKIAERLVKEELGGQDHLQTGFVAIDPQTGEVKSLVGGVDYDKSSFNRVTQAARQPGSTLKPHLYYAALENGMRPNSMLKSEATEFHYDNTEYPVTNFDAYAEDYVTMLEALAVSDNIFAVKTHFLLGLDQLVDTAARFGISTPLPELPSVALGSRAINILEMVNSYSAYANGGSVVEPHFVRKVVDRDGNILFEAENEKEQVFNPDLIAVMNNMMEAMFEPELSEGRYARVTGASLAQFLDRPTAGKSGSTEFDSWMIGYNPQIVTGVWVGNDDNERLNSNNGEYTHARAIWGQFMKEAMAGEEIIDFEVPDNVVEVDINPHTGLLATESCPISRPTLFYAGTEPTEYCYEHIEGAEEENPERKFDEHQKTEDEKREKFLDKIFDWFS
ncbi:transglycosylase domain-containing protein [Evansella cellulosilytica]|uniref:Penicillin-binding protein, 1A family n=1 Tax=Evansella cellulosilytica (strain ATCC 21833 / DSM 2522 / FERM P-1141 / JCM 9156 / N-4) TaxID=649639 RepID=E6TY34_EVAC2|nr:PBP1A family penicillin-binding protein [Evansella cellulosilytica]ADU32353.1 penicillin-binding protein, 1A family [Evansella cellulosilytica DSM 2522]